MATSGDNKQVLYGVYQYVLARATAYYPSQNSIHITEKNIKAELLHKKLQPIKYKKCMFFLSQLRLYSYFSEGLMITSSECVNIPNISALKLFLHRNAGHVREIPDA